MRAKFVSGKKFRLKLVRAVSFICDKKKKNNQRNLNSPFKLISPFCGCCWSLIKLGVANLGDFMFRRVRKCELTKKCLISFLNPSASLKCFFFFFSSIFVYASVCVDRSKQPRVNCCVQVKSLYLISTSFFFYTSRSTWHWPLQHRMPVQYTRCDNNSLSM